MLVSILDYFFFCELVNHNYSNNDYLLSLLYYSDGSARHTVKAIAALNKTLSGGHTTDGFSNV